MQKKSDYSVWTRYTRNTSGRLTIFWQFGSDYVCDEYKLRSNFRVDNISSCSWHIIDWTFTSKNTRKKFQIAPLKVDGGKLRTSKTYTGCVLIIENAHCCYTVVFLLSHQRLREHDEIDKSHLALVLWVFIIVKLNCSIAGCVWVAAIFF